MADFLCADFDEDDFDTNCTGPTPAAQTHVVRSPRYGITRSVSAVLVGLMAWLKP